ncbi:MAG TPA: MAPEG family protein [Rhizomicrobium sp.]|jgi:hypothetical protein
MRQELIFAPMGALVVLTFVVLTLVPVRRFRAAFAGKVRAQDFKYGESARVPGDVSIPNRNYMNLLELPLLFYVLCLAQYVTAQVGMVTLVLAWVYVALRALHSLIHLTRNNVMHRLVVFAASNVVLGTMWVLFLVAVFVRPLFAA